MENLGKKAGKAAMFVGGVVAVVLVLAQIAKRSTTVAKFAPAPALAAG